MPETITHINGTTALLCAPDGKPLGTERDAIDLIGAAGGDGATMVVIPAERLDDAFFRLSTRTAGEFLQKFVNYGMRIAILGDISPHLEESRALRAFVSESNRGNHIWFATTIEDLTTRLAQTS
jgi:hypothetical protein